MAATKRVPVEVGPKMSRPQVAQAPAARRQRPGWCRFKAKGKCYVEGALLEAADQEIRLSPAGSYRARKMRSLELIEGDIPTLPEDAPKDKKELAEYEAQFIEDLEDGDPQVGAPPVDLKLIKQGN